MIDKEADYVLALKGNQGTLREDVELFAAGQKANDFKNTGISRHETVDGDHGRIETRKYTVLHDIGWLQECHNWPGLKGVVMVESTRETGDKIETETRFYITSLTHAAEQLGPIVRSHWAIENSLHWVMDMTFRDDECRVRQGNAATNFTTVKHACPREGGDGSQPNPKSPRQSVDPRKAQGRRLGRSVPRKPPRHLKCSPDSPGNAT